MVWLKRAVSAAILAVLLLANTGVAQAGSFFPTISSRNWATLSNSEYILDSNPFYITPLAFSSSATLVMIDQTTPYPHEVLFTNQNLATEFGQVKLVQHLQDALVRTPDNGYYRFTHGNSDFNRVRLLAPITFNNKVTLPVGSIIIGIGLNAYRTGDKTFDDFIFAISGTAPTVTPLPAAIWLLGSGLAGLMGFKGARRQRG